MPYCSGFWAFYVRWAVTAVVALVMVACGNGRGPGELPGATLSGAQLYARHCSACHGAEGGGLGQVIPPLAGSEWLQQPPQRVAEILLRGLSGAITVAGREYYGQMPAQRHLDDTVIAKILNEVMSRWGRPPAVPVEPAMIAAARLEAVGQPPLRGDQLMQQSGAERSK